MSVYIGTVETFANPKADKEQALKITEEAAEVFSAWENLQACDRGRLTMCSPKDGERYRLARERLLEECADVIQAVCNMVDGLGASEEFESEMELCRERNEKRGREYSGD